MKLKELLDTIRQEEREKILKALLSTEAGGMCKPTTMPDGTHVLAWRASALVEILNLGPNAWRELPDQRK